MIPKFISLKRSTSMIFFQTLFCALKKDRVAIEIEGGGDKQRKYGKGTKIVNLL